MTVIRLYAISETFASQYSKLLKQLPNPMSNNRVLYGILLHFRIFCLFTLAICNRLNGRKRCFHTWGGAISVINRLRAQASISHMHVHNYRVGGGVL